MEEECDFKLNNFSQRTTSLNKQIYCAKFCPSQNEIFAASVQNRVDLFAIKQDHEDVELLKKFECPNDHIFALDWSIKENSLDHILIAGGMNGKLYDIFEESSFGIKERQDFSINDIKFHPENKHLFGVACESGSIHLYNYSTKACIAKFIHQNVDLRHIQLITLCFDPSGRYLAFGGMQQTIQIVNLHDNAQFQELLRNDTTTSETVPVNFNSLHKMCIIENLHENVVDMIYWYTENSFISKSADGCIIFWLIEGVENQKVPYLTQSGLSVVVLNKLYTNCNLWFVRFGIDNMMRYLVVSGRNEGTIHVWKLDSDSFQNWKYSTLNIKKSRSVTRHVSFSNCGNLFLTCTEDGVLAIFKRNDHDENMNFMME